MSVEFDQNYNPFFLFKNKHISTIFPAIISKRIRIDYEKEIFTLSDGDFLQLDWKKCNSDSIVILLHGLEGSSHSKYITRMVDIFFSYRINCLAINQRGCGNSDNLLYKSYHSGISDDLDQVFNSKIINSNFKKIYIVGFSLGANIVLKWLGEKSEFLKNINLSAAVISVPCDLASASSELNKYSIYQNRFLTSLKKKLADKMIKFKLSINLDSIKTVKDFDQIYTAPANGWSSADEYYTKNSSKQFIEFIKNKTLIINALNDPMLGKTCFPIVECEQNKNLHLILTQYGGHVGFLDFGLLNFYEKKILEFFKIQ